ncbi:helix-turn-helix domain-containing protein [Nocardia gipuzkoensis]|uniref:helix-turn-helix domain-containing protein n=1 Tax=Nocardia gipuzkoensis TaxID=2749991 RepID=UPI0015EFBE85|nr:helix-turn-helix domain-containing protein [Nocardia gipuzkoensis]
MTPTRKSAGDPTTSKATPDRPIHAGGVDVPHRANGPDETAHKFGSRGNNRRSKNNSTAPLDRTPISSVNIDPSPGNGSIQNSVTDHWLSTEEVSQRLQIPEKTLANWASLGKGPRFARMGRYRRYRFSDLLAWEEAQLELGESA